ncbi:hypothetical protein LDENG_00164030 [Lucifuga dentata]|nr:hypothetical protein LDENG_00164030 [Lucifuga dentata]
MSPEAGALGLRSHYWGAALRQRLSAIEAWAGRQGLELAADCHLGHISQATMLLTMNKYSIEDVKDIQSTCFKLNSLQLHMLLSRYMYAANEPHIPPDLINAVVSAAEASADNLIQSEGWAVQLEESLDLHLPFLLPEGGYSCDTVRGVPPGFREFLEPICHKEWQVDSGRPAAERGRSESRWTQSGKVAKLGASFHGLEALLSEATAESDKIQSHAKLKGKALMLYRDVDPSEQLYGNSKRKKEQMLQRNRALYHSNPNMTTNPVPEDGHEPADPAVRRSHIAAVSTINLCTDVRIF